MVQYNLKDVRILVKEIAFYYDDPDLKCWFDTLNNIKEEFSEIKEIILELLGPYVFSFTREFSKKIGLTDLIFNTPIKMMPLYIESKNSWEQIVARWRLSIEK